MASECFGNCLGDLRFCISLALLICCPGNAQRQVAKRERVAESVPKPIEEASAYVLVPKIDGLFFVLVVVIGDNYPSSSTTIRIPFL